MIPAAPKLRFPEFKEPWKPGHAGDAFKNSRAKGAAGLPIYSVTMDRGLVRRDSLDRYLAADAADGQNLRAQRGDVVYNMMRMWQGAVGLAHEECMVSPAYVVLSPKKHTSSEFFDQWFKAKRMLYLLGAYSHGLTSDRLRLYADDFARIPLHLPTLTEQQKIAAFLGAVDAKLAALVAKQAELGRFKAGLMQKLFSQQLRFTQDDGKAYPDWKRRKLVSIAPGPTYGLNASAQTFDGIHKYLRITDIDESTRKFIPDGVTSPAGPVDPASKLEMGDLLFARTGAGTGRSYLYDMRDGDLYFAGFLIRFRIKEADPRFVFFQTLTERFSRWVRLMSARSGQPGMNATEFGQFMIDFPHPDEQQKIANALSAMDAKIQAVADQITKLQTFKKGLAQQMFV